MIDFPARAGIIQSIRFCGKENEDSACPRFVQRLHDRGRGVQEHGKRGKEGIPLGRGLEHPHV